MLLAEVAYPLGQGAWVKHTASCAPRLDPDQTASSRIGSF